MEVRLDNEEWQRVLAVLAQGAWAQVNPLIMKIADQLRAQAEMAAKRDSAVRPNGEDRPSTAQ